MGGGSVPGPTGSVSSHLGWKRWALLAGIFVLAAMPALGYWNLLSEARSVLKSQKEALLTERRFLQRSLEERRRKAGLMGGESAEFFYKMAITAASDIPDSELPQWSSFSETHVSNPVFGRHQQIWDYMVQAQESPFAYNLSWENPGFGLIERICGIGLVWNPRDKLEDYLKGFLVRDFQKREPGSWRRLIQILRMESDRDSWSFCPPINDYLNDFRLLFQRKDLTPPTPNDVSLWNSWLRSLPDWNSLLRVSLARDRQQILDDPYAARRVMPCQRFPIKWLYDYGSKELSKGAALQALNEIEHLFLLEPTYSQARDHCKTRRSSVFSEYCNSYRAFLEAQAVQRAATVCLTILRYREVMAKDPDNLSELVPQFLPSLPLDPFSRSPMKMARTGIQLTIYSVGDDLDDDSGRSKGTDEDYWDRDVTWHIAAMTK